jgi:hypothetical protein
MKKFVKMFSLSRSYISAMIPEWPLKNSFVSLARTNMDQSAAIAANTIKIIFLQGPRFVG